MIDCDKYTYNKTPPGLSEGENNEFKKKLKDLDNERFTVAERKEAEEVVQKEWREAINVAKQDRRTENAQLHEQFKLDVEEEEGFSHLPQGVKDSIHNAAWEDGHSAGYHEVLGSYEKFLTIVFAYEKIISQNESKNN